MILDFADGSRADDGYRLMQRYIRHAVDSKTEQVVKACGEVFEHEGKIGIRIRHQMQPSFKEGSHSADVAFTKSAIVACSCTCNCADNPCASDAVHVYQIRPHSRWLKKWPNDLARGNTKPRTAGIQCWSGWCTQPNP